MRDKLLASIDAEDAEFCDRVRLRVNARSLVNPPAEMVMPHEDAARMLKLADECLELRQKMRAEPPPQLGPIAYVSGAGIEEASGEFFARLAFPDEEQAKRAAGVLFRRVTLEELVDTPQAANAHP